MRHLFWYLTGFGILLAGVLWGSEFRLFIDMPSLVIVLGGAIVFTLTHHRPDAIVKAVKSALGKHTGSDLSNHYQVLQNLRRITMVCGVSGGIIGLATVIRYANPASAKLMGPGMAVAILSMLYGLILSELLVGPLCAKLKSRGAAHLDWSTHNDNRLFMSAIGVVSVFAIIYVLVVLFR